MSSRGSSDRRSNRALLALACVLAGVVATGCGEGATGAGGGGAESKGDTINILAFKQPSLGAFLPAVIEAHKLDKEHGLDLDFTYTTPDNYNTEFGAGHYDVGGSAALLSEGLRTERDVDVTYLFNLFDYYGAVVTSKEIASLGDLREHSLAAATGTTNYAMFQWFAKQQGLDLDAVDTINQTTAGLSTMALTGRTDATQLWEPAYSTLTAKKPDIKTLDLGLDSWKETFKTDSIPYLGVAAKTSWADEHKEQVKRLYETYAAAGEWVEANPEEAADIVSETIPNGDPEVISELIVTNDRLGLAVAPAADVSDGIDAVFKAGKEIGYLKETPPDSIVYTGL